MTTLNVPEVKTEDFQASVGMAEGAVSMKLAGNADIKAMFPLEAMLKVFERQLADLKVPEVVVDLRNLEFMNSSCFKSFVTWLGHVQEMEPDKQYRIRFLSDASKHWQARSLNALSCFAVDLVRIET